MTKFEQHLQHQLRAGERSLDPATEASLRASRQLALAQHRGSRLSRLLVPASGMALASIAAFFLIFSPLPELSNGQFNTQVTTEITDSQDLDFYYWLAVTEGVADS